MAASMKDQIWHFVTKKIIVFDKYYNNAAKYHERIRHAGAGSEEYNLTLLTPWSSREVVMCNNRNKLNLSLLLSRCSFGDECEIESRCDGQFTHDEADISIVSHVLKEAANGKKVIWVLSDDTDIFVMLIHWLYKT